MFDNSFFSLSSDVDKRASFRNGDGTAETWLRTSIEGDIMLGLDG
jgi:hypothetical protein